MPKLHQMLETKNRKEQEKRVETLLALAREETSVITIVVRGGVANFGIVGRPDPQILLQALDVVRDDILVAVAKQEVQQGGDQEQPPEMDEVGLEKLEDDQNDNCLYHRG